MTNESTMKIILVMGITGAGKSYLIREISGQDVEVGHNLESCTQKIQQVRCQIAGQSVMLLDTPGFDDTNRSDTEVLEDVAGFLEGLYHADFRITGIIYLHNIADVRMRGSSYKNLQMFAKLCGEQSYHNVVMLTGRWGSIDQSLAEERENDLKENFWSKYLKAGCQIDRYRDKDDLIRIFEKLVPKPPVVLDIQREMAIEGKSLDKTSAGEQVNQEITRLMKKFEDELAVITAEYNNQSEKMKAQMDHDRLEFQKQLEKLEGERISLMEHHRREEEASKAGMQEQFRRMEEERERQRNAFEQRLEEAKKERNAAASENARLDALVQYHQSEMASREQNRGSSCMIL
ncbi:hypothetical protein BGX27_009150 [Mortierella sp. AM989]|nr:hypothetical protein BGX27_009150 [Mortierella sp. AM989]